MTMLEVYLWLHLVPVLGTTLIAIGGSALGISLSLAAMYVFGGDGIYEIWYNRDSLKKAAGKLSKLGFSLGIIITVIGVLLPSRQTVVLCYIIPAVANSEIIKDLPEDLHHIYSEGIDRLLELVEPDQTK